MSAKVVGLGVVCANGLNKEDIFSSALRSVGAIQNDGLASLSERSWNALKETTPTHLQNSKCMLLSFTALQGALQEAGWGASDLSETAFVFASTTSQIDLWEKHLPFYQSRDCDPERMKSSAGYQSLGEPLLILAKHFGIHGPRAGITSSCSSSLQALAIAFSWIRSQRVKRCIVGGAEINNSLTRLGFNSLRLLSKSNCRPFDKNRNGINLGEGSAFLCLEQVQLRDENLWGFLTGSGMTTDAYHPTSPHPEGLGSQSSMKAAIEEAKLKSQDIAWVYAHGTGSQANDLSEARAINSVFKHRPFVSSTKSIHGHTLGACGALESALGLMAMKRSLILPTFNFESEDPEISLNVSASPSERPIEHFLKNSLGFGGINASLVFSREVGSK